MFDFIINLFTNFGSRRDRILSAFTKTKSDLDNLNKDLAKSIARRSIKVEKLEAKQKEETVLIAKNTKVFKRISEFLGDDIDELNQDKESQT